MKYNLDYIAIMRWFFMSPKSIIKRLKLDENRYDFAIKIKQEHTIQIVTRFIVFD